MVKNDIATLVRPAAGSGRTRPISTVEDNWATPDRPPRIAACPATVYFAEVILMTLQTLRFSLYPARHATIHVGPEQFAKHGVGNSLRVNTF